MIIHYWGDIMCPFCYLGERVLSRALDRFEHKDQVHVRWKSNVLHPELPLGESRPLQQYLDQNPKAAKKTEILKDLASKEGVPYGIHQAHTINSTEVARILKLATDLDLTLEVAQAFGKGYFSDGVDYSSHSEIIRTATAAGLPEQEVRRVLKSDAYTADLINDEATASQACPKYVPTVYFNHGFMMDGILDEEVVLETLRKAYKQWKAFTHQVMTMDHEAMGPDECAAICDMPAPY